MSNKMENTKPWSHDRTKNQRSVPEGNQADFCFLTPQDTYHSSKNSYERTSKKYKDPAFTFPKASSWCVLLSQSPLTPVIDYTATSTFPSHQPPIRTAPQPHRHTLAGLQALVIISPSALFSLHSAHRINQRNFITSWCFTWGRPVSPGETEVVSV